MSVPLAYLNGQLLPRPDARLALDDAGVVFGAAVTDFCRTFHHRLFRLPDHLHRFRHDCDVCFIPLPLDDAELTRIADELVAHNAGLIDPRNELALISFATPGPIGLYAGAPGQDGPATLCLHTIPLSFAQYRPFFEQGVALVVAGAHGATVDDLAPPRIKHRSRLHWWRAGHLIRAHPMAAAGGPLLALLVDGAGCVTETAVGNLLIVRDGGVLTPPRGQVLAGVSLRVVEELCAQLGISFAEQSLTLADCAAASEAMLCGSAFCLAGVRWLAGRGLPWPGPITLRLLAAWSDRVGMDVAGQFFSGR